jgi:hypothetical protein
MVEKRQALDSQQQIEAGKQIVQEILAKLASELNQPGANNLTFNMTDKDFDYDRISLMNPSFHVVAKIEETDLADCPADAGVRSRLRAQLRLAILEFYKAGH